MTVQTLKLGKRRFVVLPEKEFKRLQRRAAELTEQDLGDIAESIRRLSGPGKNVPLDKLCRRLGL